MSYSQDRIRDALASIDGLYVYKPPDDARNWKPCDYMLWWPTDQGLATAWLEVKQNPLKSKWHVSSDSADGLSRVQLRAALAAEGMGMPYIVAVYWKALRYWTLHARPGQMGFPGVLTFEEATTRWGVGSAPANLASTLRLVLDGEAGL